MMWKRWGTPPDDSGVYSSGFDEEFNRSVEGRRSIGRPEISLFFKEIDPDLLRDPGDELKKVIAFKARIISEKKILFESFNDIREFEGKIRRCISRYVQRLRAEEAIELSTKSQMQQANTTAPESIVTESSVPKTPLTVEGTKFIRELITTTERNAGNGSFAATQVARFRLLGTIIAAQGNDEYTLGVHDSNILFANRSLLELSRRETLGLIFSALVDFPSENTPLWHWYAAIDGFSRSLLPQLSLAGSTAVRTGALFAMRLVAEPLTSSPPFSRSDFLNSWFSPKMPSALKAAALGYLGECGIEDDLPAIRQEFDRGDYQTTGAAVDAIVRVSLRESRDKAIKALYDLQPASIERNLLSALFGNSASIATNLISEGVSHKNPEIRRVSVRLRGRARSRGPRR